MYVAVLFPARLNVMYYIAIYGRKYYLCDLAHVRDCGGGSSPLAVVYSC
jgi:hypothetical protein